MLKYLIDCRASYAGTKETKSKFDDRPHHSAMAAPGALSKQRHLMTVGKTLRTIFMALIVMTVSTSGITLATAPITATVVEAGILGKIKKGVKKAGGAVVKGAKRVGKDAKNSAKIVGGKIADGGKRIAKDAKNSAKLVGGGIKKRAAPMGYALQGAGSVLKDAGKGIGKGVKAVGKGIAHGVTCAAKFNCYKFRPPSRKFPVNGPGGWGRPGGTPPPFGGSTGGVAAKGKAGAIALKATRPEQTRPNKQPPLGKPNNVPSHQGSKLPRPREGSYPRPRPPYGKYPTPREPAQLVRQKAHAVSATQKSQSARRGGATKQIGRDRSIKGRPLGTSRKEVRLNKKAKRQHLKRRTRFKGQTRKVQGIRKHNLNSRKRLTRDIERRTRKFDRKSRQFDPKRSSNKRHTKHRVSQRNSFGNGKNDRRRNHF